MALFDIFDYEFMRNAFLSGSFIAFSCGLVGYFMVVRDQMFAGDAMSHAAFTGAMAAIALGFNQLIGLFVLTLTFAILVSARGKKEPSDVFTGNLFSWLLGIGVFFLSIFISTSSGENSKNASTILFGSIYGIGDVQVIVTVLVSIAVAVVLLLISRPLLFVSIDPDVAEIQGIKIRKFAMSFLLLLSALMISQATQIVGALLVLGLIATPALLVASFVRRPFLALLMSGLASLVALWLGLSLSYVFPQLPPSFAIITPIFLVFLLSKVQSPVRLPNLWITTKKG